MSNIHMHQLCNSFSHIQYGVSHLLSYEIVVAVSMSPAAFVILNNFASNDSQLTTDAVYEEDHKLTKPHFG